MNPYNIEIFDRNFNFKYTALLDSSEFSYSEDALDPENNTIKVPTDFDPYTLSESDSNAPKSWYIRVTGNGNEYQGIITGFTAGETYGTITYTNLLSLFDLNAVVSVTAITETTVEEYIKSVLETQFVSNSDSSQLITGLAANTITTTSGTTGTLSYTTDDDAYTAINIIDNLIVDAFNTYGIFTSVSVNFAARTINVTIGTVADSTLTVEGDLPNIIDATYTIRKVKKEVNKVLIWDDEQGQQVEYYLHSDGTYDTTDRDRIVPVVNQVVILHATTLGEASVNDKYDAWIDAFTNYATRDEDLTTDELTELREAAAGLNDAIKAYKNFYAYGVTAYTSAGTNFTEYFKAMYNGTSVTESDSTGTYVTSYMDFNFDHRMFALGDTDIISGWYTVNASAIDPTWASSESSYVEMSTFGTFDLDACRALFVELFTVYMQGYVNGELITSGTRYYRTYYPITGTIAQAAYTAYKNTNAWQTEVNTASGSIFAEQAAVKAKEVFAKNTYTNLIELTCAADDSMLNPLELQMGQVVEIVHDGRVYNSILSGREVSGGTVKLIFGTLRLELTKILKEGIT